MKKGGSVGQDKQYVGFCVQTQDMFTETINMIALKQSFREIYYDDFILFIIQFTCREELVWSTRAIHYNGAHSDIEGRVGGQTISS